MAGLGDLRNLLSLIGEVDIRPIRDEAVRSLELAVVAQDSGAALQLVDILRRDSDHPTQQTEAPVYVTPLDQFDPSEPVDLVILMLDADEMRKLYTADTMRIWRTAGWRACVIVQGSPPGDGTAHAVVPTAGRKMMRILYGNVQDSEFLRQTFVPAVLALLPDKQLALARNYPLFRGEVVRRLINDTATSNAAYSLTTGLAEIIPVLNIPLNVTDMIILTKAQAFLVYRLGLALGLPVEWQSYLKEFGGILGGGFLWRQLARMLVGFIPAFGILPKVAISYAGTYTVGQVVYQWYLTGRHISAGKIQGVYRQALETGRLYAAKLFARRFGMRKLQESSQGGETAPKKPRRGLFGRRQQPALPPKSGSAVATDRAGQACSNCGRLNQADASFCQYCGLPLGKAEPAAGR